MPSVQPWIAVEPNAIPATILGPLPMTAGGVSVVGPATVVRAGARGLLCFARVRAGSRGEVEIHGYLSAAG